MSLVLQGQCILFCSSDYFGIHKITTTRHLYPSYFKLQVCWLRSFTRITYLSKLIGILSLTAFLQLELFWV
ncbi:hypothetical protein Dd1591_3602 [Dickeya chrysanthemi Ech1591]|uniref:Uncharacterized protein n=1 Tax=Dickeya chrysanthemi (strain Ech1591) TaxID=561229 RepID=C6CKP6_DICC1|nr:hypothetical protein Dd1591_3602 [Dickeya chrysanthemi Ech1591]